MATPANFRDLGGLATDDGRRVRSGMLYRGEFPHWLAGSAHPPPGLRTAIDLRREVEVEVEDVAWSRWNVERVQHSIGSGTTAFAVAHSDSYLAADTGQVAATVTSVLEPGRLPLYFFCAAGKDRTGLLAIVVLALLGVLREEILDDFGQTGVGIGRVVERLRAHDYYRDLLAGHTAREFVPRTEAALTVLDWLEEQGGAVAWAEAAGIPRAWVEEFRATALEADPPER